MYQLACIIGTSSPVNNLKICIKGVAIESFDTSSSAIAYPP